MCGIIAYKGNKQTAPQIVVDGLKILEYRGYDSWGVGYIGEGGKLEAPIKRVGAIGEIGHDIQKRIKAAKSKSALGQTRWATTGKVNKTNAHPHFSMSGRIALVQNGIVENFFELKTLLKKAGFKFKSQTDTEVIVNLIEHELKRDKKNDFKRAVQKAFKKLKGRNAIVALFEDTGEMIAARQGSPLIIGVGTKECFIASDIPAFLKYTNRVIYLDDGQLARFDKQNVEFFDMTTGRKIKRRTVTVDLKPESAEKGDFQHFMIKEIMDQKETIKRAVNQNDKEIERIAGMINDAYGTFSVACGTAGYAAMIGEYLFAKIARKHINFSIASEFAAYEPFLTQKTLMLVTSQSGETADVLEAMEAAGRKKVKIVSLVNVRESSIAKKSDHLFYINAGPEKAVASTKAFTAQVALHTLLAYSSANRLSEAKQLLVNAAGYVNDLLNPRYEARIKKLATKLRNVHDMYIIGRGLMYPVALEIALKVKEVSYVHADGLPGGELKHGTLALISNGTPCIVVVGENEDKESILSNAQEIKVRGGYIIGIAASDSPIFDYYIRVPDAGDAAPIVSIIPGQIFAYHLAVLRGHNPDKPRNLAKSVTVK